MSSLYVGIRVKDRGKHETVPLGAGNVAGGGKSLRSPYVETACGRCGEMVWHDPANSAGLPIVCWQCA